MNKAWQIEITGDGSPTLTWTSGGHSESMHHSGGAFSETEYIYGSAISEAFRGESPSPQMRFVSVGLGLGYNELFIAAESVKLGATSASREYELWSYESDEWLREAFRKWIFDQPSDLSEVYDSISVRLGCTPQKLKFELKEKFERNQLRLEVALLQHEQLPSQPTHFLWDAFSKKTSPELWDESFLKACFAKAQPGAVLVTYAYNGNLVRALKATGFVVQDRGGFRGKRSSLRAEKRG